MKFSTLYTIISLASLAAAAAIGTLQINEVLDGKSEDWNCVRCGFYYAGKNQECQSQHCVSLIVPLVDLKFRIS